MAAQVIVLEKVCRLSCAWMDKKIVSPAEIVSEMCCQVADELR